MTEPRTHAYGVVIPDGGSAPPLDKGDAEVVESALGCDECRGSVRLCGCCADDPRYGGY